MRQAASLWTIALFFTALPLFFHRCSGAKQSSTPPARQSRQRGTTPTSARKRGRPEDPNKHQRRPAPTRPSSRYDDDDDDIDDSFRGKRSGSEGAGTENSHDDWADSCEDDLIQGSSESMAAALNDDDDDIDDQDDGVGDDWNVPPGAHSGRSARRTAGAPFVRTQKNSRGNTRRPSQYPPSTSSGDYQSSYDEGYDDDEDGGYDRHRHEPKSQRSRDLSSADDTWSEGSNDGEGSWNELAPESRSSRGAKRPRPSAWTGDSPPPRSSRRQKDRKFGGGGRGTVTRYQRRPPARPAFGIQMPAFNTAAIASAFKRQMGTAVEAMGHAGSVAATTTKRLKREVKLAISGSWESALLKVTWPDDTIPDEVLVRSLVEAVKEFKRDSDVTKNSAEHRVLLRKLWTKMSEPDWRTVTKAVYLFHSILQQLPVQDHTVLKIFLGKMSREWDKRTGCRYFDLEVLCDVSQEGQTFRSFVDRYGTYVFTRAEGFNSRFQELDNMRPELGWEHVVTTLAKAIKTIDLGVACQPEPEEETEVTVLCLRSTAQDVRQLWRRYHSALAWILEEAETGSLFDGLDDEVVEECVDKFKDFYSSSYSDVSAFLADAEELLGIYGLHVPDLSIPPEHTFDIASASGEPRSSKDEREGSGDEDDEEELDDDTYDGDDDGDDDVTHGESKAQAPQSLTRDSATRTPPAANNNDKPSSAAKQFRVTVGASGDTGSKSHQTPSEFRTSPVSTTATTSTIGTASSTPVKASGYPTKPTRVLPKSAEKRHDRLAEGVTGSRSAKMVAGRRATAAGAPTVGQSGFADGPAVGAKNSGTEQGTNERAATSADTSSTEQTSVKIGVVAGGGVMAGGMGVEVDGGRDEKEQVEEEEDEETEHEDSGVEDGGSEEDSGEEDSCEEGEVDDVDDLTYFDDATQAEGTEGDCDRC